MRSIHTIGYFFFVLVFLVNSSLDAQEESASGFCRLKSDQKLWSGPSSNFKVVRVAEKGLLLEIIGEKAGHYRVCVPDGFQCYISTDYLSVDADSVGTVTGNRVRLRSIPGVKGDYPIYYVDREEKLLVWDQVGEWYYISAPDRAYLYVLKEAVEIVETNDALLKEVNVLRARGRNNWQTHRSVTKKRETEEKKASEVQTRLINLQKEVAGGFKGMKPEEVLEKYKEIAASEIDDTTRQLVMAFEREVEAVIARRKARR